MENPLDAAIRLAQAGALKLKRSVYVVQDGPQSFKPCAPEDYSKENLNFPIRAIINAAGLIIAKD